MGICCSKASDKSYAIDDDMELLPDPPGSNAFDRFKNRFPLSRTHVNVYFKKVGELEGSEFTPE